MAITIRKGIYSDFVQSSLQPGEFADVTSGDPNTSSGKALYICLASGNVVRIASSTDIDDIATTVNLDLATWAANLAPEYSASSGYSVGDFAVHNSILYKCRTTIPAGGEAWNASHWTQTTIMDLVPDIDTTLTVSGDTADAKVTGDKISRLENAVADMNAVSVEVNKYSGYISYNTNKWSSIGSSTYAYTIIPVNGGDGIEIKNGTRSGIIAALTAYSTPSNNEDPHFSAAEGWTATKAFGSTSSQETFIGDLPSDAKFLYVQLGAYAPAIIKVNGYEYTKQLIDNLQNIIGKEDELHTLIDNLESKTIKCDRIINSASTLVPPYDDLNTLPQGSIVTFAGRTPSNVPEDITDTTMTAITYNYVNSTSLIGGAVQLLTGNSGNAWIRMKYTNSRWTQFKNITVQEKETILVPALSTFDKIGIVGDSWSSGSVYTASSTYQHYPKLRWGYIASKLYGFVPSFFTSPGATTQTWLTRSAGLPALQEAEAQELYICCLGINDHAQSHSIGTTTDMDDESADTFYGSYGKIIRAIKAKAPLAKIALALVPMYNANVNVSSYNTAIRNIAEHFSIGLLDTEIDAFFNSDLFANDRQWNHLTAVGYTAMANAINSMLAKDYETNREYWRYSMI